LSKNRFFHFCKQILYPLLFFLVKYRVIVLHN
jgi:hypothetical protein